MKQGDIVIFNLNDDQRDRVGGNHHDENRKCPAVVLAVWGPDCANLFVMPDSDNPGFRAMSASRGDGLGMFQAKE